MAEEKLYSIKELQAFKDVVFPHGDNALLNDGTVRPGMHSAIPVGDYWSLMLPLRPNRIANDRIEIFTGQTNSHGSNPADTCSTAPMPGNLKKMQILRTFGTFHMQTQQVNVVNTGERRDYADVDHNFLNRPDIGGNPFMPDVVRTNPDAINTAAGKSLWEFGNAVRHPFASVAWHGLASRDNSTTYQGFITESDGMDRQVRTGYNDAISGVAAPAADSYVVSYDATIGTDFVAELSNICRVKQTEASMVGMSGTQFVIVINPRLEFQLYDVWACNYHTARCTPSASNGLELNTMAVTQLRDQMRAGRYILIDGMQIPVRTDWGLEATQNATTGEWQSDVYFLPVSWAGMPLMYWDYKPFNTVETTEFVGDGFNNFRILNNGLYLMTYVQTRTCYQYQFNAKVRLNLDTPFLAARLDNVSVANDTPFRSPYSGDPYFVNGGQYYRA